MQGSRETATPGISIGELFSKYCEVHARIHCKTAQDMIANFGRYLSDIQHIGCNGFAPLDAQSWHSHLAENHGEPTANRSLTMLRTIYNFGAKWELIEARNPARAVRRFREEPRQRVVSTEEMPRLLSAIDQYGTYWTKDLFLLCLYTAQRLGNVCSMKWSDIDFARGVWRIPSTDFKTGRSHEVPLVTEALTLLKSRLNSYDYVFPGRRDKRKHLDYPYNGWRKILKAAGINDLRPHDLRRTHATWQSDRGENLITIARTLGHSDFQSTAVYAWSQTEPIRLAMQSVVSAMRESSPEPPPSRRDIVTSFDARPAPLVTAERAISIRKGVSKNSSRTLSKADQSIVEGKILACIKDSSRSGGTSKKAFYRKIGECFSINSREMNRILEDMMRRGLIVRFQKESSHWHYAMRTESVVRCD